MPKVFNYGAIAIIVSLAVAAMPARADTFAGNAVGSWSNPSATGSVYTIRNNDNVAGPASVASLDFGTADSNADTSNLFTFNGVGSGATPGFTTASNASFAIGAFTYRNGTTTAASYPETDSSVKLGIQLTLTSPISTVSQFSYNFNIDITPNNGTAAQNADTVTIANGTTATTFSANGQTYTLALLGFSQNNGATFTNTFVAPEQTTTGAQVYATITTNLAPVPEPASLGLLAVSVAGLGLMRRRFA